MPDWRRHFFDFEHGCDEVKAMNKRKSLLIGIAAAVAVPFVLGTTLQAAEPAKAQKAAEGINVGGGEQGIDGVIVNLPRYVPGSIARIGATLREVVGA